MLERPNYFLLLLTFLLGGFFLPVSHLSAQNPGHYYSSAVFSALRKLPPNERIDSAQSLYKTHCRKMPEPDAMKALDGLDSVAREAADLRLECAVFDMRADYYSVNRGYNNLSSQYYDKAILFAEEHELPLETAVYMHRKAVYYLIYKQNVPACRYFLFSQEKFREIGFDKVPNMGSYFGQVADFYYNIGDYENARENLHQALKYRQQPIPRSRINILNTIGLTYRNSAHFNTAMRYFNEALTMAKNSRDSVWVGIVTGNIGSVYFMQGQYARALPLVEADYAVSLKYRQTLNAAIAMLRLVRISMEANKLEPATRQLNTVDELLLSAKEDVLRYRVDYYELKALLGEKFGRIAEANLYRKKLGQLKDSLASRDNLAAVERIRLQWELDKSKAQLTRLKTNAELGAYKRNAVIIVLTLLMVIIILVYSRQRLKEKKDKDLLALEKRRLDEELKNASLALHGYTENLMQKNLLIEEFKTEVEKLKLKLSNEGDARDLDNMMKAHIMTDENWNEFKKLFTKAHPAFFFHLRNKFSHLTDTDIRLLALIRLKLNNREMAGMLGITTEGVKKAKQRLRKKMAIDAGTEIEDFIIQ